MGKSKISWTDQVWNPVTGCSHVSRGCEHCYAERLSLRYKYSRKPWTIQNAAENVVLHPERLDAPLHWQKPRHVFVNSMSDLFHAQVSFEFIDKVFYVMTGVRRHTFQILTKRPQRMLDYFESRQKIWAQRKAGVELLDWFGVHSATDHIWLGVSCEDQKTADERIPLLLQTPADVRFVSCEPLLGEIDLRQWIIKQGFVERVSAWGDGERFYPNSTIDWVITGGESGPHFRPMNLDWARSLRDQCVAANVPYFFKQESAFRSETNPTLDGVEWHQMPGE